jgi:hypothetical protein
MSDTVASRPSFSAQYISNRMAWFDRTVRCMALTPAKPPDRVAFIKARAPAC